jgi:hypothetical protein
MPPSLKTACKAIQQIGFEPVALNVLYRFGLVSGHYRRLTPAGQALDIPDPDPSAPVAPARMLKFCLPMPAPDALKACLSDGGIRLLQDADQITRGFAPLFASPAEPLEFSADPTRLRHWTVGERKKQHWIAGRDVKYTWEPARFGWAYTLARAYLLSGDESYTQSFWDLTRRFFASNPPNLGPNWASGQEVALRLLALVFAGQVFSSSPFSPPNRMDALGCLIAAHAQRIPPTLVYARSQQNNHLISEAAGLLTAAIALPEHANAEKWRTLGSKWFNRAIQAQIGETGEYSQHSSNYHRLMLHLALWTDALLRASAQVLPVDTFEPLARAILWLAERVDPDSGQAPNLGANDGALILPLADCAFADYRPTLQAAGRAYLGKDLLPAGPWDELSLWLGLTGKGRPAEPITPNPAKTLRIQSGCSWASLRAVHYADRPSHADQLSVDLWFRGSNLALDPGAYLYNAPPPWDNSLAGAAVHNNLSLDGLEPMTRAGRFLWLDWDQAQVCERNFDAQGKLVSITAERDGYKRFGVAHRRTLACIAQEHWTVTDQLTAGKGDRGNLHRMRLSWLLPDGIWELNGSRLRLQTQAGQIQLTVRLEESSDMPMAAWLIRAGELVAGHGSVSPIQGWYSPTYGQKIPALAFCVQIEARLPITLVTEWDLAGASAVL